MHSLVSIDPRNVTTVAGAIVDALPEFAKLLRDDSVFLPSHIVRFTPLAEGSGQFLAVVERRHNDYDTIGYAIVDRGDVNQGPSSPLYD